MAGTLASGLPARRSTAIRIRTVPLRSAGGEIGSRCIGFPAPPSEVVLEFEYPADPFRVDLGLAQVAELAGLGAGALLGAALHEEALTDTGSLATTR